MSNAPKYLDLDSLVGEIEFVVKLNGHEHRLKEASVGDFIANTKQLQAMDGKLTVEDELTQLMAMILRSFPTMKQADLTSLTVVQLNKLVETAFEINGQTKTSENVKSEAEVGN